MPAAQGMSWYSSRRTTKFSKLNGFIEPILYDSSNQDISINYVSLISFCVPHEENWIARFAMVKNRMGTTRLEQKQLISVHAKNIKIGDAKCFASDHQGWWNDFAFT